MAHRAPGWCRHTRHRDGWRVDGGGEDAGGADTDGGSRGSTTFRRGAPLPQTSTRGDPVQLASAVARLDAHVARVGGADLYAATEDATAAVDVMVRSKNIGGTLEECLARSDGVWEVCVMPHMLRLSAPLGITFRPVRYSLKDGKIGATCVSGFRVASFEGGCPAPGA